MLGTESDDYVAELDQVHGRRAEKGGDERVGRIVIDFGGCAKLMHDTFIQHHDAVTHGHGLHLVVRDVDRSRPHAAVKALQFFARQRSEFGVEVRKRLVEKKDGGFTHDGARQGNPLTLTAGEFARLAIKQRANAQQ